MYYKLIPQQFITIDKELETKNNNYIKALDPITRDHINLFETFIEIDKQISVGLDLTFSIYNKLQMLPDSLVKYFDSDIEEISVTELTGNFNHKEKYVSKNIVKDVIKILYNFKVGPLMNGTHFWEYLFEKERYENFQSNISRYDAYFVFEDYDDCLKYKTKHNKVGEIVKIEPIKIKKSFRGDMNLMDMIENHFTYSQTNKIINSYWNQEKSEEPIREMLFSGSFVMKEL